MSTTRVLRTSGQFSLKARPMTRIREPVTPMPFRVISLITCGGHIGAHAVVDSPPGEDHLGVVAEFLRLVGEIVGIDADAMPADQAGTERQEIPLGAGGLEHFLRYRCRCD